MIGSLFLRTFPFFIQTILSGKQNVTGAFLPRLNPLPFFRPFLRLFAANHSGSEL